LCGLCFGRGSVSLNPQAMPAIRTTVRGLGKGPKSKQAWRQRLRDVLSAHKQKEVVSKVLKKKRTGKVLRSKAYHMGRALNHSFSLATSSLAHWKSKKRCRVLAATEKRYFVESNVETTLELPPGLQCTLVGPPMCFGG
jgi:protein-disulfide isomerase-like protein with CxxC motif